MPYNWRNALMGPDMSAANKLLQSGSTLLSSGYGGIAALDKASIARDTLQQEAKKQQLIANGMNDILAAKSPQELATLAQNGVINGAAGIDGLRALSNIYTGQQNYMRQLGNDKYTHDNITSQIGAREAGVNLANDKFDFTKTQTGVDNKFRTDKFSYLKKQDKIHNDFLKDKFDWQKKTDKQDYDLKLKEFGIKKKNAGSGGGSGSSFTGFGKRYVSSLARLEQVNAKRAQQGLPPLSEQEQRTFLIGSVVQKPADMSKLTGAENYRLGGVNTGGKKGSGSDSSEFGSTLKSMIKSKDLPVDTKNSLSYIAGLRKGSIVKDAGGNSVVLDNDALNAIRRDAVEYAAKQAQGIMQWDYNPSEVPGRIASVLKNRKLPSAYSKDTANAAQGSTDSQIKKAFIEKMKKAGASPAQAKAGWRRRKQ